MELYLLRHAIAVDRGTPGYEDDSLRPLTPAGAKKMRRVAAGMKALGLRFDWMLSSPYLRAKETAAIVRHALPRQNDIELCPHLAPGGDPSALVALLNARANDVARVLLVGHEPYLSEFASLLISGHADAWLTMKKGGLCKLAADTPLRLGQCATLEWLLAPSQLVGLTS